MLVANIDSHQSCLVRELPVHGIMGSNKVTDISCSYQMGEVPAIQEYNLQLGEVKLYYVLR